MPTPYTPPSAEVVAACQRDLQAIGQLLEEVRAKLGVRSLSLRVDKTHSGSAALHASGDACAIALPLSDLPAELVNLAVRSHIAAGYSRGYVPADSTLRTDYEPGVDLIP